MKTGLLALTFLSGIYLVSNGGADMHAKTLDTSNVTAVVVTGEASSVNVTTTEGAAYEASLTSRRSGWFFNWYSSWYSYDCQSYSKLHVEGSTLFAEVAPSSWIGISDCTVEIAANVRKESAISITQMASQARLTGDFSTIILAAKAADISLDGHVTDMHVQGDAIRAHIAFDKVRQTETVAIKAKALDAYLGFGKGTPISYTVVAKASWVDSSLPNTPGAKPAIDITGEFVRATIR